MASVNARPITAPRLLRISVNSDLSCILIYHNVKEIVVHLTTKQRSSHSMMRLTVSPKKPAFACRSEESAPEFQKARLTSFKQAFATRYRSRMMRLDFQTDKTRF